MPRPGSIAYARPILLLPLVLAAADARGEVLFQGLGFLSDTFKQSVATAVSADGSVIAGISNAGSYNQPPYGFEHAFRWTAATGMVDLGDVQGGTTQSFAEGISGDGGVIVGQSVVPGYQAMRWSASTGMVSLGTLPGGNYSIARAASYDGSVVVGGSNTTELGGAFRWTAATGMVNLGVLPGANGSSALAVSADGNVIVGGSGQSYRWTPETGMVGLGHLPGGDAGNGARAMSADGAWIAGDAKLVSVGQVAYRWHASLGMQSLGDFPGGAIYSTVTDISADGNFVIGVGSMGSAGDTPFIWDAENGMRPFAQAMLEDHGLETPGWTHRTVYAMSDDGRVFVGFGVNPHGQNEAWRIVVPEPHVGALWLVAGALMATDRRLLRR